MRTEIWEGGLKRGRKGQIGDIWMRNGTQFHDCLERVQYNYREPGYLIRGLGRRNDLGEEKVVWGRLMRETVICGCNPSGDGGPEKGGTGMSGRRSEHLQHMEVVKESCSSSVMLFIPPAPPRARWDPTVTTLIKNST